MDTDQKLPDYNFHVSLLSLPKLFVTNEDKIPAVTSYLKADELRVAQWKELIGRHGLKIGICWQCSRVGDVDLGRSFPLISFYKISLMEGVRLFSLQKGEGEDQLKSRPEKMRVEAFNSDFDSGTQSFLDTAAVMMNLDLIITSDTAIAHLAGALGRPTWVALKYMPDWRWMLERTDSPWYPTMRLFRQKQPGDWASVFHEIELALLALLDAGRNTR